MKKDHQIAFERIVDSEKSLNPKDRDYKHKKAIPIPTKIKESTKSLSQAVSLPNKPPKLKVDISPLFFIEKAEEFYRKKIISMEVKERKITKKNLQIVSKELQEWIYANSTRDIKFVNNKEKQNDWGLLMQKTEERHFQIDRIIKYLSD